MTRISRQLVKESPLESESLYAVAGVMFRGNTPTFDDLEMTGTDIGLEFEQDGAVELYAYTSLYEDVAMLFEVAMMKALFEADHDVVFTKVPEGDNISCQDYEIEWGVRNRLSDDNVWPRAQFVVASILPDFDHQTLFNQLPLLEEYPAGSTWCDTYDIDDGSQRFMPEHLFKGVQDDVLF